MELGGTYLSDSLNASTTTTSSQNFYNVGVLFNWNKKVWAGWSYLGVNSSEVATETKTFATQDTGPMLKWQFGRDELYSLTGVFNILSQATYSNAGSSEKWTGTSMWVSFGVMPELSDGFHIGVALNYYAASYTKKSVSGTETTESNSKTWIFPTFLATKSW
ncbi:hypothetical protein D3C72_1143870 [compost metagenome]